MDEMLIEKLFNEGHSARAIGRQLNMNHHKVAQVLKIKGYTLLSNRQKSAKFASEIDWNAAYSDYKSGLSLTNIGKKYGVKYDVIREHFLKQGLEIRTIREAKKLNRIYEHKNIFDPMTNQGAYLLGWILADGTLGSKLKSVRLRITKEDREHTEYLRSLLTNAPVGDEKFSVGFSVTAVEIYESLIALGVKPRKSFTDYDISWDLLQEQHYPYLLLGLFEGDGSISKDKSVISFLLPSKLMAAIHERIFIPLQVTDYWCKPITGNRYGLMQIRFQDSDYYTIGTWMYSKTHAITPLPRKYSRFINNLNRVSSSRSPFKLLAKQSLGVMKV
ncbi:hypothetical protein ACP26L_36065 (plasmid) [Paenibacillus sp. S-38]|uniref:hypothetical protein n=1 Tax=Paenibacillus sp. S-38 TaxID=3416710 RepID=UPI003CEEAE74